MPDEIAERVETKRVVRPHSLEQSIPYVPIQSRTGGNGTLDDQAGPGTPIFHIGYMTALHEAEVEDAGIKELEIPRGARLDEMDMIPVQITAGRQKALAVYYGLRGWENFMDEVGNAVPFKAVTESVAGVTVRHASWESVNRIPSEIRRELANEIMRLHGLKESEKKV